MANTLAEVSGHMVDLSEKHLSILRHMLGIDTPWIKNPNEYRDYYCSNPDYEPLLELEEMGMVVKYSERWGYHWFKTTDIGKEAARESQRRMLLPRPKRRYRKWLSVSDCVPGLTFEEFLTLPEYKEARNNV